MKTILAVVLCLCLSGCGFIPLRHSAADSCNLASAMWDLSVKKEIKEKTDRRVTIAEIKSRGEALVDGKFYVIGFIGLPSSIYSLQPVIESEGFTSLVVFENCANYDQVDVFLMDESFYDKAVFTSWASRKTPLVFVGSVMMVETPAGKKTASVPRFFVSGITEWKN